MFVRLVTPYAMPICRILGYNPDRVTSLKSLTKWTSSYCQNESTATVTASRSDMSDEGATLGPSQASVSTATGPLPGEESDPFLTCPHPQTSMTQSTYHQNLTRSVVNFICKEALPMCYVTTSKTCCHLANASATIKYSCRLEMTRQKHKVDCWRCLVVN